MNERKNAYLLDTSVILDDPNNIYYISENNKNIVVITKTILEELDSKKDDMRSDAGFRAREFFRLAYNAPGQTIYNKDLPKELQQNLVGMRDNYYRIELDFDRALHGEKVAPIILYVIYRENYDVVKTHTEPKGLNDAKIGEIAKAYQLTLLTNDISFKISSQTKGIKSEAVRNSSVKDFKKIQFAYQYNYLDEPTIPEESEHYNFEQVTFIEEKRSENSEVYETGLQKYAITVNETLEWCDFDTRFGEYFDDMLVRPINLEQKFYYTLLTHPLNYVTAVSGSTGSGKTLMALQAGLELINDGIVDGIVYARNTVTASDPQAELGYRKGDQSEKLGFFMYPLYNAINYTIEHQNDNSIQSKVEYTGKTNSVKRENATDLFMEKHNIEVMDIAHMRGTTISRKFVIIDEAQNMTNATLKLIGTRMGEETRLVIMGDPNQIDHPFLSRNRNALVSLLNKATGSNFVAGIQLKHTIRSEVASWFDKNM